VNAGDLPLLQFSILRDHPEVVHAVTTKAGGDSIGLYRGLNLGLRLGDDDELVRENRRRVAKALGFDLSSVVTPLQVHGATIEAVVQDLADRGGSSYESGIPSADGLLTNVKGMLLMIKVADCFPVFLFDPQNHAVGLVHAGWRGTAQGIVACAIGDMVRRYGSHPDQVIACVGPGIQKCCFTVGEEVLAAFGEGRCRPGRLSGAEVKAEIPCRFDLQGAIYRRLRACGIRHHNIEVSEDCTFCRRDLFFSYRRDAGKTGRMAALIGVKKE